MFARSVIADLCTQSEDHSATVTVGNVSTMAQQQHFYYETQTIKLAKSEFKLH